MEASRSLVIQFGEIVRVNSFRKTFLMIALEVRFLVELVITATITACRNIQAIRKEEGFCSKASEWSMLAKSFNPILEALQTEQS